MVSSAILDGENGIRARVIPFGARLTHLWAPDRDGNLADIVLGPEHDDDYATMEGYLGATCGRFAGRIAGAEVALDGKIFRLDANEGHNHLHGGAKGIDRQNWEMSVAPGEVIFRHVSDAGEMGYPGRCAMTVCYRLEGARLSISMQTETDAPTPINLINHSYFNLAGVGTVEDHHLQIAAASYLPVKDDNIPTGQKTPVAGTVFDFTASQQLGQRLAALGGSGFDHTWCLEGQGLRPVATLSHHPSGRRLRISSNQPGLQLYTAGHMTPDMPRKGGAGMERFAGVALEAQAFPNAPNEPGFPNAILRPGELYENLVELDVSPDA